MKMACALRLLVVIAAATGCGEPGFSFGDHPDFYWWTDHESPTSRRWTDGPKPGAPGGFIDNPGESRLEVVAGIARSGAHAAHVKVFNPPLASISVALAGRNGPFPGDAYYSAWFYLPAAPAPRTYWTFFRLRSPASPGETAILDELNLSFTLRADGSLGIDLDWPGHVFPLSPNSVAVPIGEWFQIEAFQHSATEKTGQIQVWQDDVLIFDYEGSTPLTPFVDWSVGAIVDSLKDGSGSELYIDDAAITKRRLGPSAPPFAAD